MFSALSSRVQLTREPGQSLGINIMGGRGMGQRLSSGEMMRGVFIKQISPNSPAAQQGTLQTGDRILEVCVGKKSVFVWWLTVDYEVEQWVVWSLTPAVSMPKTWNLELHLKVQPSQVCECTCEELMLLMNKWQLTCVSKCEWMWQVEDTEESDNLKTAFRGQSLYYLYNITLLLRYLCVGTLCVRYCF